MDRDKLRKNINHNLISPLKDKGRVMKLEYVLSNNYFIAAVVIVTDLLLLLVLTFLVTVLSAVPKILTGMIQAEDVLAIRSAIPSLAGITAGGVIGFILLASVLDVILIYRIKVSWSDKTLNVGQRGTDRFTTEDEIKEQYTAIEPLNKPYPGEPGILISRIDNTFYIDQMVVNNLFLGITRSGKGETEVKTSIEIYSRSEKQPSLIINDPKIELYKSFGKVLEGRGYTVHLLNASNPALSMGFNLIGLAVKYYRKKDYDTAEQVANSLAHSFFNVDEAVGDMVFFTSSAAALFTAMCLASIADAFEADRRENPGCHRARPQLHGAPARLERPIPRPLFRGRRRAAFCSRPRSRALSASGPEVRDALPGAEPARPSAVPPRSSRNDAVCGGPFVSSGACERELGRPLPRPQRGGGRPPELCQHHPRSRPGINLPRRKRTI